MKKKIVSMLLVAAMVASMAVGCGSKNDSGNSDTKSDKGESITFMAPDWAIPSDDQLDEFTKETGIEVEVSEVGWDDIREKLATAATGNKNVADVVEVDWSWVGEFKAAGWLEPLKISDADKEDFLTLDTFTVDDEILALPYSNDYRIAYYNKDQFAKAGINEAPKTYAEVLEDAKALKASGVDYPLAMSMNAEEKAATGLMWTAFQMDGVVWNDDGTFNKDAIMDALNYYQEVLDADLVAPEDKTDGSSLTAVRGGHPGKTGVNVACCGGRTLEGELLGIFNSSAFLWRGPFWENLAPLISTEKPQGKQQSRWDHSPAPQ